jgi:hypothetical protein
MKIPFRALTALLLGSGLLAGGSAGCTTTVCGEGKEEQDGVCVSIKSTKKFGATDTIETRSWRSGGMIEVHGNYGDITVVEGSAGEVQVEIQPFKHAAHDADPDEMKADARDFLDYNFVEREDGGVYLSTGRTGGGNGVGADLIVRIPPDFDGRLRVWNESDGPINPGEVDVGFVGSATSVNVATDKLGRCTVRGHTTVTRTTANCDGPVVITGVSDVVDVTARAPETDTAVDVTIARINGGTAESVIEAEDGDVALTLPASADFVVQASTQASGVVDFGDLPRDECNISETGDERSKTLSCGSSDGARTYKITAGIDCLGDCNVTIAYQ